MRVRQSRLRAEEVPAAIERREEFRTGRLQGGYAIGEARFGDLPESHHADFHAAHRDTLTYVIRSSGTPIAWRTFLGGWIVPADIPGVPHSHRQMLEEIVASEAAIDLYAEVG
ncbi:hypothetical protein [Rhodococcus phage REQ1]|uniref:hypothetical protein n=1 Tax=Rhodococcus phage REQ1 TaxID=1109712 RepID=UPI00023EEBEA|nr:hypothetical protein RoPhREQ1_gp09 [Rhodococcus phage REQ1]AEV52005.1 hypothetical protein [Rhodococcus phage REQ1]